MARWILIGWTCLVAVVLCAAGIWAAVLPYGSISVGIGLVLLSIGLGFGISLEIRGETRPRKGMGAGSLSADSTARATRVRPKQVAAGTSATVRDVDRRRRRGTSPVGHGVSGSKEAHEQKRTRRSGTAERAAAGQGRGQRGGHSKPAEVTG